MKRVWVALICAFFVTVLLIFILFGNGSEPTAPRFVAGTPASLPAFTTDHYDWGGDVPFEGGKMWLWTAGTDYHAYLYDLHKRVIVGELVNGSTPELVNSDNSKIMCQGPDAPGVSLKERLLEFARKMSGGKIKGGKRTETFWVLDVRSNSARRIGAVSQFQGTGSRWRRSPNARYGYTTPTGAGGRSLFLCDLSTGSGRNIPIHGQTKGWWSEREVMVQTGTNSFELLDVETQTNRTLFTPKYINDFLTDADLKTPCALEAVAIWNGHGYDFYFSEKEHIHGLSGTNSFLLKAERAGPALKLLSRDFKFQWGVYLDSAATRYLYEGESGKPGNGGNGAVYLRSLTNGTTITVVPPDSRGQYAIPRFYGDEVIYFHNRLLQRVRLDGSNSEPILTMPAK